MLKTIAAALIITSAAWAVAPAHAIRLGCPCTASAPWYASILGLILSE